MSALPIVVHAASARRRDTGWSRWFASCPCGWVKEGRSRQVAEHLAELHNRMNPGGAA